ncbi:MAG: MmgE/PrpD family protein [Alphaproteobacteria bacterium]|nr:MmgE/PrpD family protein [Alphaproteobacteria bacterium]
MSQAVVELPETTMPDALTRRVAAWIAGLRHEDLPETTRRAVRLAVLDTLGAGLAGIDRPWPVKVREWAGRAVAAEGAGRATVWGEAEARLRPADAALVNAVAAHAFELDDFHAKLHPGAVVLPAALALAEANDVLGTVLETAVAVGYEIMIRTSLALDPNEARLRGWHLTGVCGPLGAAAAGIVILGLDAEEAAWALGLAGTQGAGLFCFNADGAMSKRMHPGFAASSGVAAAELAGLGITGPTALFEADDGSYLRAFSDVIHPEQLIDGLGARYHLEETSFKPYACCGSLHAYVDAALALRQRLGGPPAEGQRVRAGLCKVVEVQCGFDYAPGTELNAQMNARYCIAAALAEGGVLPPQFAAAKMADPEIVALAERIELVHDPELDGIYPTHYVGWVEIEQADGGFDRVHIPDPSGSVANPEREAALRAKFAMLMSDRLGPDGVAAVSAATEDLADTAPRRLVAMLAG